MKITIDGRQPITLLQEADEIRVRDNDINKILDFIESVPEKTIIYRVSNFIDEGDTQKWNTLHMYNEKLKNFLIQVDDGAYLAYFLNQGFKAFWTYPVNTYYDLQALKKLKPAYIVLGEPLCFELTQVKSIVGDIPLRMTVNYAYDKYLPRDNGLYGKWVRPEDLLVYESYIDAIDFRTQELSKEEILFKTYKKREWLGNINFLITNLNINADNRAIPNNFGERRCNCGQICMKTGNCHYCDNAIVFNKMLRQEHDKTNQKKNI